MTQKLNTLTNQTIALAGIAQAASLVQQLATQGKAAEDAMTASIGSVLKIDADNIEEIYGGLAGIHTGLQQLDKQLTGKTIYNPEQARYSASLIFLERQLAKQPKMLETIRIGIERAQAQAEHYGLLHENVLANLGEIYHTTISTIQPRIMINGEEHHLSRPENVNKIRSLLLAGIRSALLWRQCGGTRWKFLLFRNKLQNEIKRLLKTQ
jgi:high frequency lysogenization protein